MVLLKIFNLFRCCPLVWMFCQMFSITRINCSNQRALRIICNNDNICNKLNIDLRFEDLLLKVTFISIHLNNISLLDKELYKVENNHSTHLMYNHRNIDYNRFTQSVFK